MFSHPNALSMFPDLLCALLLIVGAYAYYVGKILSFYIAHWRELQQTLERQKQARRWKQATRKQ
ncbi:hypothetical protein SAMN06269173_11026 [Hymenobacter mucosus]|uniref:Uncharacterized protein n=2 Tax=Hymenobacter mucosus TaxID=1411120 RepID=A0A238ZW14_9BACT|nr:hypothetical protein SAMN06269173_11026 [Hymenobacter mucosus]